MLVQNLFTGLWQSDAVFDVDERCSLCTLCILECSFCSRSHIVSPHLLDRVAASLTMLCPCILMVLHVITLWSSNLTHKFKLRGRVGAVLGCGRLRSHIVLNISTMRAEQR